MNNPTPPAVAGFNSILASLIEAQERAEEQTVDVKAWTDKYPQYASQIQSYFGNRGKLEEVLGPRGGVDLEAPTIGAEKQTDAGQRIRYFGDYELLEEIARGGMGVVFKARQVSLNRIVAVKMILSGNLADPSDVQRFHAEAEAAANLDHPNIVPIYEVGEHEGQHYLA
ncbi:MAG: protein kinase [Pirellulales bacterium]